MAEANVKLRVDSGDAVRKLTNVNTAAIKLNRTVDATKKKTATATANIQRFGISFRSVIGPVVAITGAATLFNRSLSKFAQREADVKVLTSQLTRLGATSTQIEELKKAADELGDATLFSQDDFIQSFNVLSSFRAIAVSSFTEVSEVAANIAQVMGTDVKSATVQLAKALEDPTRGLTALSRSGITFDPVQTKMIKNLVKSNKLLDAQALILETVKGQYDEAARAAGTGFAGAVDLLTENTDDLTQALGKGLEPAAAAVTNGLANLVKNVSQIPTPMGQAALAIGGATAAVYALKTANDLLIASKLGGFLIAQTALFNAFGAQIYLTAAAVGFKTKALVLLKGALVALPWAAAIGAITVLIKQQYDLITAFKQFDELIRKGTVEELNKKIKELETSLTKANNKTVAWHESMLDFILGTDGASTSVAGLTKRLDELKKARDAAATDIQPIKGFDTLTDDQMDQVLKRGKYAPPELPKLPKTDPLASLEGQVQALKESVSLAKTRSEEEEKQQQLLIDIASLTAIRTDDNAALVDEAIKLTGELLHQTNLQDKAAEAEAKRKKLAEEAQTAQQQALEAYNKKLEEVDATFRNSVVDSIMAAVEGTKSLSDSLVGVIKQMARLILQQKLMNALKGFSFTSFFGGFFADGGRPPVGRPSIVGERGPELFVPGRSGTIVPNHELGGGGSTSVVVNVDASGTNVEGDEGSSSELGALVGAAVQNELIKQQRPGGLLSR